MSNYTKSTNFATKDNLSPGDPLKVVRGTEIDTEFNNISTAIATKTDNSAAAITGGSITGITDLAIADGGTGASTATAAINNLLPVQTSAANKYLQSDGTNVSWDAVTLSTADITGTLPVANGGTGVTSSTGTGSVVLSNSPTLVTPALGTPASGVATNLTGLPISTGVSGLGTGVATFLGTPSSANLASAVSDETGSGALVFANSPTLVTPALGTPSALVGTNITGTASGLTAGNVTTNANLTGAVTSVGNATSLGSFTSSQLASALTDETGSGANVFATSPTLVTPILGTPTSATLTNATGLPLTTGVTGTLPTANGGTNLTSFTSGGVVYASSTSALATGSALTFNGTTLALTGVQTITNSSGSTLTLDRTSNPGSLQFNFGGTQTGQIQAVSGGGLVFYQGSTPTEALTLTSTSLYTASGINVGIGNSNPLTKLHVSGGNIRLDNNQGIEFGGANNYIYGNETTDFIALTTNGTEALRINASQNMGINNTNPSKLLTIGSTTTVNPTARMLGSTTGGSDTYQYSFGIDDSTDFAGIKLKYSERTSKGLQIFTASGYGFPITFSASSASTQMTLDTSGNLLVGTTSAGGGLNVKGTTINEVGQIAVERDGGIAGVFNRFSSDGQIIIFRRQGTTVGDISVTTLLTTYNTTSDYRLKTVIGPVADAGQRIDALRPVEYTWNSNGTRTRGFLAHQFQEVYAGSVTGTKDAVDAEGKPVYQAMQASTSEVIADLVAEIQSLRQRVAQLETN